MPITKEVYTSMGLNEYEFNLIVQMIGREPSYTELGMFAVMWSEHCGYKYSRPILSKAFKKYKEAIEGAGLENAGVIDIGDGMGVTMKVESHNHPSSVEPYQGAATGVGGIIRDILTMGARPIASLNSLRFGPIESGKAPDAIVQRNRYLFDHVVGGIAGYGNCVGVPTVAGEVNFHPRYSGNPLVNAMCVGILPLDKVTTAAAEGAGNPVLYLGSATGRDGIHGATFASEALDEESESKRPNVQIGDPFAEKQVIEATLEALETGAIVAIQDMGAAGLTCSTIEMSAKGEVGMEIDLDLVPMREADMSGYELMLSESQERMLAVAHKGREREVLDIFHKWGVKAEVIGYVIDERVVRVRRHGELIAEVDPLLLADQCPTYTTEPAIPAYFEEYANFDPSTLPSVDVRQALIDLLKFPDIASKKFVFRQYDQQVQTQTAIKAGKGDAAVLAPAGCSRGISVKIDGNARYVFAHPRRGGRLAVAEAARNVACTGAMPVAATDGLNYGNPQQPHVYWQFSESVFGIAEAAEALGTPVVSGNVSFYNESELGEVLPTPLIGVLGVIEDPSKGVGIAPKAGDSLVSISFDLPSDPHGFLGASAYAYAIHGVESGYPADTDLEKEAALAKFLVKAADSSLITAAHDVSDGGAAVALAEMSLAAGSGLTAELSGSGGRLENLFGERPGHVFVATTQPDDVVGLAKEFGLVANLVGTVGSQELNVTTLGHTYSWPLKSLSGAFEGAIPAAMEGRSL